jgi:hypothetical protein
MYFNVPQNYQYADTYKFDREINGKKVMRVSSVCWFTNILHNKRNTPLDLYRKYNPTDYEIYDNYCAINVDKVAEIPEDDYIDIDIDEEGYPKWKADYGDDVEILENQNNMKIKIRVHRPIWGTPITFLDKHCPTQFEIVGISNHYEMAGIHYSNNNCYCEIDGKRKYVRLFIKKVS